jgi:uncharacterized protein YqgC (DUF456 family)
MYMEILLWVIATALVIAGLIGLVFPIMPGPVLLFAGLFCAAWAENFMHVGFGTLTVLGVMTLVGYGMDFLAGAFGAKRFGASRRAVIGAAVGALVGIFFGIPGVLLGPFVGAVLGEFSVRPDLEAAGRAGIGAALGLAVGAAVKLAIAFAMIGVFLVIRFL